MSILEILASTASIISIPLAIYYARKNNTTISEKARLDIIKTLSHRLSTTHDISYNDIDSVYKSKLREHEISHAKFSREDILNDLKTDVMSNAFLNNDVKCNILSNLSKIVFPSQNNSLLPTNKLALLFVKFFVSPLPFIFLISNIIVCVLLLWPYLFTIISNLLYYKFLPNNVIPALIHSLNSNIKIHISFTLLFILSVICFFRKKKLNNI